MLQRNFIQKAWIKLIQQDSIIGADISWSRCVQLDSGYSASHTLMQTLGYFPPPPLLPPPNQLLTSMQYPATYQRVIAMSVSQGLQGQVIYGEKNVPYDQKHCPDVYAFATLASSPGMWLTF